MTENVTREMSFVMEAPDEIGDEMACFDVRTRENGSSGGLNVDAEVQAHEVQELDELIRSYGDVFDDRPGRTTRSQRAPTRLRRKRTEFCTVSRRGYRNN